MMSADSECSQGVLHKVYSFTIDIHFSILNRLIEVLKIVLCNQRDSIFTIKITFVGHMVWWLLSFAILKNENTYLKGNYGKMESCKFKETCHRRD